MIAIKVQNLSKHFKIYHKQPGITGSIKSLFFRKTKVSKAVDDISFKIDEGEVVGFIGPNGAGKTTTLKCLSGLLYPTTGQISVLGFTPFDRKNEFLKQISLVMGQKNQLWWDLPAMDTFLLNKEIYQINDSDFKNNVNQLIELLDIADIINVQVRKLSLGQRMKCELIASLIHQPKVLFLDEPTIGLDVVMQKNLREFIKIYNQKYNATIILTSHYMQDVKHLCDRVIVIDHGKLIYDGQLDNLMKKYSVNKKLSLTFTKSVAKSDLQKLGRVKEYSETKAVIVVDKNKSNAAAEIILKKFPIEDLNIEEIDIEDIIRKFFAKHE